ncbi:MAG TPA: flagellar basal body rod protein FlgB [Terriglobales bacterium]
MSMIDSPEIRALAKFLDLSALRTELITSNMANIDTPGYRARDINFRQELQRAADEPGFQLADFSPAIREVEGLAVRPDGNDVSLEREGLLLAETQLKFQTAVQALTVEFHQILNAIREGGSSS